MLGKLQLGSAQGAYWRPAFQTLLKALENQACGRKAQDAAAYTTKPGVLQLSAETDAVERRAQRLHFGRPLCCRYVMASYPSDSADSRLTLRCSRDLALGMSQSAAFFRRPLSAEWRAAAQLYLRVLVMWSATVAGAADGSSSKVDDEEARERLVLELCDGLVRAPQSVEALQTALQEQPRLLPDRAGPGVMPESKGERQALPHAAGDPPLAARHNVSPVR